MCPRMYVHSTVHVQVCVQYTYRYVYSTCTGMCTVVIYVTVYMLYHLYLYLLHKGDMHPDWSLSDLMVFDWLIDCHIWWISGIPRVCIPVGLFDAATNQDTYIHA